jgi:hypothetical protein
MKCSDGIVLIPSAEDRSSISRLLGCDSFEMLALLKSRDVQGRFLQRLHPARKMYLFENRWKRFRFVIGDLTFALGNHVISHVATDKNRAARLSRLAEPISGTLRRALPLG